MKTLYIMDLFLAGMKMKKFFFLIFLFSVMTIDTAEGKEKIVNPNQIYTYDQLASDLVELKKRYPSLLILKSIGISSFGNEIWAVKIGRGKENIVMVGAHHGREWLTSTLLMKMMEEYLTAYEKRTNLFGYDTNILDEVSIWFVPMLNPDGVTIQQKGIEWLPFSLQQLLIEMNENQLDFSRWKANGLGIDLNRQYPAGWGKLKGTSTYNFYQLYKGEYPLQAPEARALVNFTYQMKPLIAVSYHSSGRVLYWYYQNHPFVFLRDFCFAKKFSELTGYSLSEPPSIAEGGGYTDWFITEFHRPALTPEISFEVKDTSPPLSVFPEEWERNKAAGLMIATEAKKMLEDGQIIW
jgi:g-D-glutamyl-meso-diaminopimelate peptidase